MSRKDTTDAIKAATKKRILEAMANGCRSGAEIGDRIGKTRSAVIGFCHRNGIPLTGGRGGHNKGKRKARVATTIEQRVPTLANWKPRPEQTPPTMPQAAKPPPMRTYGATCAWDGCDEPTERGSYCHPHGELIYAKPRETKRIHVAVSRAMFRVR